MKRNYFLIVTILMVMVSATVFGQEKPRNEYRKTTYAVKLGVNSDNIFQKNAGDRLQTKFGVIGGGYMENRFTKRSSLTTDILLAVPFRMFGHPGEAAQQFFVGGVRNASIYVPVMYNFYMVQNFSFKVGLQFGCNFGQWGFYTNKEPNLKAEALNAFDLSLPVGLSYYFNFGLMMEVRAAYQLTPYGQGLKGNVPHHFTANFALGWRFNQ